MYICMYINVCNRSKSVNEAYKYLVIYMYDINALQ